ncbi:MAG: hypothetical protein ACRDV3_15760 [Acidothermaceae bacterium]
MRAPLPAAAELAGAGELAAGEFAAGVDAVPPEIAVWVAESVEAVEACLLLLHADVARRLPTTMRPIAASFLST